MSHTLPVQKVETRQPYRDYSVTEELGFGH
jgi:hypothetical protein